jgi:hypothetical protein
MTIPTEDMLIGALQVGQDAAAELAFPGFPDGHFLGGEEAVTRYD